MNNKYEVTSVGKLSGSMVLMDALPDFVDCLVADSNWNYSFPILSILYKK